jgi:hypothetical protein
MGFIRVDWHSVCRVVTHDGVDISPSHGGDVMHDRAPRDRPAPLAAKLPLLNNKIAASATRCANDLGSLRHVFVVNACSLAFDAELTNANAASPVADEDPHRRSRSN